MTALAVLPTGCGGCIIQHEGGAWQGGRSFVVWQCSDTRWRCAENDEHGYTLAAEDFLERSLAVRHIEKLVAVVVRQGSA